jgi:GGDEF domain-containing protein
MFSRSQQNKLAGSNTTSAHRLLKQQAMPSLNDLRFMLQEAQKIAGRPVEMPWFTNATRSTSVMLTARVEAGSYEPIWAMYSGDDTATAEKLWEYNTGDINLVHSLALQVCPDAASPADLDLSYAATKPLTTAESSLSNSGAMSSQPSSASASASPAKHTTSETLKLETNTTRERSKAILEGELENMQVPTLLQSINMSKMTGRLNITHDASACNVYFHDGTPQHADSPENKGDAAIVEILTWEQGQFRFYPNEKCDDKTIKRRLDGMIMEGIALLDQVKFLNATGLNPDSLLLRKHDRITDEQFKEALSKGAPLDMAVQRKFYEMVDNRATLEDLLRRVPMTKNEWAPIMFNLMSCSLVSVGTASAASPVSTVSTQIDRQAIQSVVRLLTRQETGIYTYPAFLFFAEQEFIRCAASGWPLSMVVFELKFLSGDVYEYLPMPIVRETGRRLESIKRAVDTFAHFETFDYAFLLPNTYAKSSRMFANRIIEILTATPLGLPGPLSVYCGIAGAPEHTQDLGVLLNSAKEAKGVAKETGQSIMLYGDYQRR